jgi:hypothetical protein
VVLPGGFNALAPDSADGPPDAHGVRCAPPCYKLPVHVASSQDHPCSWLYAASSVVVGGVLATVLRGDRCCCRYCSAAHARYASKCRYASAAPNRPNLNLSPVSQWQDLLHPLFLPESHRHRHRRLEHEHERSAGPEADLCNVFKFQSGRRVEVV